MNVGKLEMEIKTKGLKKSSKAFRKMTKYAIKAHKALCKLEQAICDVRSQLPLEIQIFTGECKNE